MKKIIYLLVFILICYKGNSQTTYPVNQALGAPNTLVTSKGGFKADSSLVIPSFSDTSKANISPYLKKYPGSLIRVQSDLYMRNSTAVRWNKINTDSTGSSGTVTSIYGGYAISTSSDPITISGTVNVDTSVLSGKYLRLTDTSNKWVNSVTKVNDTTINVVKGTSNNNLVIPNYWLRSGNYTYLKTSTDSIGIGTSSPAYKFDISGSLRSTLITRLADDATQVSKVFIGRTPTSGTYTSTIPDLLTINGSYAGGLSFIRPTDFSSMNALSTPDQNTLKIGGGNQNYIDIYPSTSRVARFINSGSYLQMNTTTTLGVSASSINAIELSHPITSTGANSATITSLHIKPTYNQSTFGTGTIRGIYYNPTVTNLNTSPHYAWESTSGGIKFGGMSATTDTTTYKPVGIDASGNLTKMSNWISGGGGGSGTVTSIATGYGLSGGTITTSGTLLVDSATLSSKYLRIVDTTNKWVTSVTQPNDSTIRVVKNSTTSDYVIRTAVAVSATRLVTAVYNNSGSTIAKGSVVYINGAHSSILPTIALAQANAENTSAYTYGLVENDIPTSSSGVVIQSGTITNLNLPTSTYTDGQTLYLSPTVAGGYTTVKPSAPNHYVAIGTITRAHPTFGTIQVAIRNGFQLDEMSDVQIPAVPNDSTLLQFSRVDSLWHAVGITSAIGSNYIKPSDTSVFQRKNIAAYSFQANNTNAAANSTSQYFKDTSGVYTGTPVWTFTGSAPTGATNHSYRWTRMGRVVNLNITLFYGTAGATCTQVVIPLPSDAPTPVEPSGVGAATEFIYPITSSINTSATTIPTLLTRGFMRANAADNGYELILNIATGNSAKIVYANVTYWTP